MAVVLASFALAVLGALLLDDRVREPAVSTSAVIEPSASADESTSEDLPEVDPRSRVSADSPKSEDNGDAKGVPLFNTAETRKILKSQGASDLEIKMMFLPAKLRRYREIIDYYRATGDENALIPAIQNTLCNAIVTQLDLLGGGMQETYREMAIRDLMEQGMDLFSINGVRYVFPKGQFRPWTDFNILKLGQSNDSIFSAQWFYEELDAFAEEVSRDALRFTGNRVLEYAKPWRPGAD